MTIEQIARLYVIFKTLEPEIKEWISSDDTAVIVKAIVARFVLSHEQERKVPILVLRLVTQDLPPESFKAELAKELGVDENMAKEMTYAIAKDIIGPIAPTLRYGGIDTNLLGFNAPPTSPSELRRAGAPEPQRIPAPEALIPPKANSPQPFILHEEPQINAPTNTGRSFSYTPHINEPTDGKIPPRVVIERVVHYSELRTPLNVATTHKDALNPERARIKTPQSKWFI